MRHPCSVRTQPIFDSGRSSSTGKEERSNTGPSNDLFSNLRSARFSPITSDGGLHRISCSSTHEYSGGRRLILSSFVVSLSVGAEKLKPSEAPSIATNLRRAPLSQRTATSNFLSLDPKRHRSWLVAPKPPWPLSSQPAV